MSILINRTGILVGRLYMEELKHAHIRVDYELGIKFIQLR